MRTRLNSTAVRAMQFQTVTCPNRSKHLPPIAAADSQKAFSSMSISRLCFASHSHRCETRHSHAGIRDIATYCTPSVIYIHTYIQSSVPRFSRVLLLALHLLTALGSPERLILRCMCKACLIMRARLCLRHLSESHRCIRSRA